MKMEDTCGIRSETEKEHDGKMLFKGFSIQRKNFLLIFFLILNSVTWFYLIVYKGFLATNTIPFAPSLAWLYYLTVLVSMLIGPIVAERVKKMRFLLI